MVHDFELFSIDLKDKKIQFFTIRIINIIELLIKNIYNDNKIKPTNILIFELKLNNYEKWVKMEMPGIDPGTSRMQSERSTKWATSPCGHLASHPAQLEK